LKEEVNQLKNVKNSRVLPQYKAVHPLLADTRVAGVHLSHIPERRNNLQHARPSSGQPAPGLQWHKVGRVLRKEMDALMKRMGYGHQPYFVYKHKDVERTHFHIVSTRIDVHTHKK